MAVDAVLAEARAAKESGASRFCMGAAWRRAEGSRTSTSTARWSKACARSGLETCATLGMLTGSQAQRLKASGLDYLQTTISIPSPDYYGAVITTRNLPGASRHARSRARRRHPCLLRRYRRHGRERGRPRRHDHHAGWSSRASRERADQHAGQGVRHSPLADLPDDKSPAIEPLRFRAHHRGRPHHHAEIGGAALRRARGHERGRPRRYASSPAPTRSSTALSCSPRPIPSAIATCDCWTSSA